MLTVNKNLERSQCASRMRSRTVWAGDYS